VRGPRGGGGGRRRGWSGRRRRGRSGRRRGRAERAGGGRGRRRWGSGARFKGRTLPPDEVPPTAGSTGGMSRPTTAHSGPILPPVHPAVTAFRRTNRRLGDIFEKKNKTYIFEKSKKNKNKKTPYTFGVVQCGRQCSLVGF